MGILNQLMGNAGAMSVEAVREEYGDLLTESEQVEIGFSILRDVLIFTDKRLIFVDKQGVTGKKVEYLSLVYSKISQFSIESAGSFDLDAELKIWVSSQYYPSVQKRFDRSVNVYHLQTILASYIMKEE
ncbi:MAG: helicase [Parcubacteria group bacterium SW_4_49_11]|nr:MAG: helicase [Parcubacteria group bacterium SW_4_49_11]